VIGEDLKLEEGRLRLDIRKKFFTQRSRAPALLSRAVGVPSLEVPMDEVVGSLSW